MVSAKADATAISTWLPVYKAFIPFPFVCFTLVLFTDIAYWLTSNLMWQNFSSWLLLAGLVIGALALLAGCVDLIIGLRFRPFGTAMLFGIVYLAVLILGFVNSLVHSRDGWTAVVPLGLTLSCLTVILVAAVALLGRSVLVIYANRDGHRG